MFLHADSEDSDQTHLSSLGKCPRRVSQANVSGRQTVDNVNALGNNHQTLDFSRYPRYNSDQPCINRFL